MTKEQIKKAILNDEGCLDGIVDIIYQFKSEQEEPKIRFLQNEIVYLPGIGYGRSGIFKKEIKYKLSAEMLAATVGARIPDAGWAAVDANYSMHWYKNKPGELTDGWGGDACRDNMDCAYRIYCPVDDWTKAAWRLE